MSARPFPYLMRLLAMADPEAMGPPFVTDVRPPLTDAEIERLEKNVGVPLPGSYKDFLHITGGFHLDD